MEIVEYFARELKGVVVSVAPLVAILLFLKLLVFRSSLENNGQFAFGVVITIIGLFLFLQGSAMSLIPVAESTGALLVRLHRPLILLVAFGIGFAATLVEPALTTVTHEAEEVSVGVVSARFLTGVAALGFAVGMTIGIAKVIYNFSFLYVIIPALIILAVMAYFCDKTFTAIAFDCAGATTGPVNIPVNMAIALGLARSVEGLDPLTAGFGLVGTTVLGVAASIMAVGLMRTV